ncbi:MAG TPA: C2 family cysteine protease [Myxococcaceae bacterium]|nr:C2 family cysteine protease [Myxococcaceae bacterium]
MNVSDAGAAPVRQNPPATPKASTTAPAAPQAPAAPAPKADAAAPATQPANDKFVQAKATGGGGANGNPKIDVDSEKNAQYQHLDGTPFIQGSGDSNVVEWNDIHQQDLGDCYFMSSLGEIAKANPQLIQNAIKDNGDGSYNVRLYEKKGDGPFGWFGHHYEAKDIRVTPDFPMVNGSPVFAGTTGDTDGAKQELWPLLMEKAFAQSKGSYNAIGNGGNPGDAMAMLTGKDSSEKSAKDVSLDQLSQALASGNAVTATSLENGKGKQPYDNGQLHSYHVYMVTGVDKQAQTVTLRNPWGTWTNDVVLPIADFNKYMSAVDFNATR